MGLFDFVAGVTSVSQAGMAIPSAIQALFSLHDRRRTKGTEVSIRDPEVRHAASEFLEAALRVLRTTDSVHGIGVPPPKLGGLWSWPYVVSAMKRIPDQANEVIVKLGVLMMLSDSDELNAEAVKVAGAVGEALQRFPRTTRRVPTEFDQRFKEGQDAAMIACSHFVAVIQTGSAPPTEELEGDGDVGN